MTKKILWFVMSGLMVLSLLMAACGPATTPTTPTTTGPIKPPETTWPPARPTASTEKPQYGGTVNFLSRTNISNFLLGVNNRYAQEITGFVYEEILSVDRTRGAAGTGETSFGEFFKGYGPVSWQDVTGHLAESWETPEIGVWVLNIRKGVHFALDPSSEASRLANGREMTADDIVFSIDWVTKPADDHVPTTLLSRRGMAESMTIEKTGPWEVTLRTPVDPGMAYLALLGGGTSSQTFPKEVAEKYYKKEQNWRHAVGTGPYMLTDFVDGSQATFTRNPNYWKKNPVGPGKGDSLPYPDHANILIVPDLSTRLAAIRTGQADWIDEVQAEDAEFFLTTNPYLQFKKYQPYLRAIGMRQDRQDMPYSDVRVRQALQMAIDYEGIKRDLYNGQADILTFPVAQAKGTEQIFTPMEDLPEAARALYSHDVERAKQLLAEAGYPEGFEAEILVTPNVSDQDVVAVLKDMWAKIGVDLEIQTKETGVLSSIRANSTHEQMIIWGTTDLSVFSHRFGFSALRGPMGGNTSRVDEPYGSDPVIEAAFQELGENMMINWPKTDEIFRELTPYIIEQAYYIVPPAPHNYRVWQPWIKNYYGEAAPRHYIPYPWVDQELKESMGY
ncbi:ABC transporter substrate-binding protein [Chloroflexota bacterium]